MKTRLAYVLLMASLMSFVACQSELVETAVEDISSATTIIALADKIENDADTKASMAYKYDILWEAGDEIYVEDMDGNNDLFVLSGGAGTNKGTFSKKTTASLSGEVMALYPASIVDQGRDDLIWPAVQTESQPMLMYSETTIDSDQSEQIGFKSMGAMLQLNISSLTPGVTLKSIKIQDGSKSLSGHFSFADAGIDWLESNNDGITLDLGNGKALGQSPKSYFICVPPGTYGAITFTFISVDGLVCKKGPVNLGEIKRNTVRKVTASCEFTHEAVQLWEDGPYWSTMNIGASSPEEYGLYFNWGNVTGYTPSGTTFSYSFDASSYTGTPGSLLSGDIPRNAEYDAAQALWGSEWKIPANADFQGLINNCDMSWGDTGILITGRGSYSDRSIFLPAAGIGYRTSLNGVGVYSYYWSGSGKDYDSGNASSLFFNVYTKSIKALGYPRYYGMAIRPVKCDPPGPVTDITLNRAYLELEPNETFTLTATVLPANAANKEVVWTSNNVTVATVDNTGMVVAKSGGSATISVISKDGGHIATCTVTVKQLEEGALHGKFSVGAGKQIQFSKGNLQAIYDGSKYSWGFAEHQYDYVGDAAGNTTIDSQKSGAVVDLFGWSTSANYFGISTSTSISDYYGDFKEWGQNIGDGSTWRTLSHDEWTYLFNTRANASDLYKPGVTVCGKPNCLIIAPDGFTGSIASSYDASTWPAAEAEGLVCLPAAGLNNDSDVWHVTLNGCYWSSSACGSGTAYRVVFDSRGDFYDYDDCYSRSHGYSVRLITDVERTAAPGALPGKFRISATKQVRFSQGNLQATYNGSQYTWDFAARQYDYVGKAAGNTTIDSQKSGAVVDLFGWSTSANYFGISTSTSISDYSGDFVEWGKNIGDGSTWRTLSKDEWTYLFNTRTVNGGTGEGKSYQRATINSDATGVYGMILYPDNYTETAKTSYTSTEWAKAERKGCVFLPAAGYRYGSTVGQDGGNGLYWSSSANGSNDAYSVYFNSSQVYPDDNFIRYFCSSVRLITESK